ncbi:uncharacterized protein KY384_007497 [Bacidia gigantensis]|uniref:uncharacterized protein n=1 Tax=Bacidia gigantensis TaxID=2732470 RepID=UPI001D04F363|nr:uncharacterized protein KY384_007497 [Bacidia gigantensis]KAG8527345.1 hypothetical protein KY384_007497 [Bacidia gigantensis]
MASQTPNNLSETSTRCSSQENLESLKSHNNDIETGVRTSPSSSSDSSLTIFSSLSRHFSAELSTRGSDIILLLCWFTTGFLDSTIFQAYRTFVSMQTGNTVFIGLGASANTVNTPTLTQVRPYGWLKSLVSLIAFVTGSFIFARIGNVLGGPNRRLTFTFSFATQTLCIFLSAVLVQTGIVESRLEYIGEDIDWMHLIPIILLSFQAPAQTACGRAMGLWEVPTVVVTTMIYDFASDKKVFAGLRENASRNRRFAGYCCLVVGAILGGFVTVHTRHIAVSLWVSMGIKACVTLAWMVWPAKKAGRGEGGGC